jgi:protein TonB
MMRERFNSSFKAFLALSAIFHLAFLLFSRWVPALKTEKPSSVEIELLLETLKQPSSDELNRQIVDQGPPINDEVDTKAKYLSAHNQKVVKETIAQQRGEFRNASQTGVSGTGGEKSVNRFDRFLPQMDFAKIHEDFMQKEREEEKTLEEEALKRHAENQKRRKQNIAEGKRPGQNGDAGSQTLDYIDGIDPGLETLLSTKEFVYYTYFSRIRNQLNQHWGPKVRERVQKLYQQGRSIASSDNKVTKLLITLDQKGHIYRVQVIGNSGIRDLDEAAVDAFRAAAPFPNPPRGMVDEDGYIKIRWDFILEA